MYKEKFKLARRDAVSVVSVISESREGNVQRSLINNLKISAGIFT